MQLFVTQSFATRHDTSRGWIRYDRRV